MFEATDEYVSVLLFFIKTFHSCLKLACNEKNINLAWLASVFRECSCVISQNQKATLFSLPSVKASCPHRAKAFHPRLNLNTTASIMNEGDRNGERARNEQEA